MNEFIAIFAALGLFFLGLLLMLPAGKWLAHRLESWPTRPMDNQERKAAWALKYHQATPITPNTNSWPWVSKGNDHE